MPDDELKPLSLAPDDHALWWKTVGEGELRQLLYWRWDPIPVADYFPATAGEYDDYAGPLMAVLRDGAEPEHVFDHLREVEVEYMGSQLSEDDALRGFSHTVIDWYAESVARWANGLPPH